MDDPLSSQPHGSINQPGVCRGTWFPTPAVSIRQTLGAIAGVQISAGGGGPGPLYIYIYILLVFGFKQIII